MTVPWDSCRVAFHIADTYPVWEAFGVNGTQNHRLPVGWEMLETDISGLSEWMAIFRVEGRLTHQDGVLVRRLLDELEV